MKEKDEREKKNKIKKEKEKKQPGRLAVSIPYEVPYRTVVCTVRRFRRQTLLAHLPHGYCTARPDALLRFTVILVVFCTVMISLPTVGGMYMK